MDHSNSAQPLGLKEHRIRFGGFAQGFAERPAELGFVSLADHSFYDMILPFSIVTMDNGGVLLLGGAQRNWREGRKDSPRIQAFCAVSYDSGRTFSSFQEIPGSHCRPSGLVCLGHGELYFRSIEKEGDAFVCSNFYSSDYGQSWSVRFREEYPPLTGRIAWTEGDSWVDFDAKGNPLTVWETLYDTSLGWPTEPTLSLIRKSNDKGISFTYYDHPANWIWKESVGGKEYRRSVGEASLVRAQNGWMVAALRTDIPAKFLQTPHDDSLCGLAVALSRDDGATWSDPQILFEAGRHHPSFVRLPDGRLVMTYIVRDDIREGRLASYRRGCEALISEDNGLSWNRNGMYILDEFQYLKDDDCWFDGNTGHCCSTLAPDGSILTVYGNYSCPGMCLIKWHPDAV